MRLALLEAEIDFAPDQEVPANMLARMLPDLAVLREELARHLTDGSKGERLRAGVTVAVVGATNVGKSSLVNLPGPARGGDRDRYRGHHA